MRSLYWQTMNPGIIPKVSLICSAVQPCSPTLRIATVSMAPEPAATLEAAPGDAYKLAETGIAGRGVKWVGAALIAGIGAYDGA
mmetsp:Transcript_33826/g.81902  ORF Transcript_33826/g.81902 Transcript_33826/m.81902 type:complete len:84 (-) Transcript_33826:236-487(-)